MILSFLLMGVAIAGMALTPSYLSIGTAAPMLVVGWRLLQGFALGGEVGPIAAFLVEAASLERRGICGSLLVATSGISVFAAGLVGFGLSSALDTQSLDNWGWRCAFLLGAGWV
jgi:MFS family permease